ncbi:MAG: hypothetical protein ACOH1Y_10160 [Propionicimonas sp.]
MELGDVDFIKGELGDLCAPLHRCLGSAAELALEHCQVHGLTGSGFEATQTHLTRGHLARALTLKAAHGDLGDWQVGIGNNTSLLLRKGCLSVKVLHPINGGTIPPPGPNRSRRAYYSQTTPGQTGLTADYSALMALWSYDPQSLATEYRIVRPTRPWPMGGLAMVDIDFLLPPDASDLVTLEFIPDDDNLFLPFELDETDEADAPTSDR